MGVRRERAVPVAPEPLRPLSRLAMRALGEFITHVCSSITRAFDGDLDSGLLFVTLLRRADLGGTGEGARPISINALSRSVARPFETVRRLCNALCDKGLVVRSDQGLLIPSEVAAAPLAAGLRNVIHDNLVRLVIDLTALGYPMPPAQDVVMDRVAIECSAIDLILFSFEFGIPAHPGRGWQRPYLFVALMVGNARGYTFDAILARRYSDSASPPPDSLRTPISASALARAVMIPYPTVRRNLEAMIEAGQLVRTDAGGYLVTMAWMQHPASTRSGDAMIVQLERILRQLAQFGFAFGAPETAYRKGPPPFLDFR